MNKPFYLSAREADNEYALAYAKAITGLRHALRTKLDYCNMMAEENQPCWHEARGLEIALHFMEQVGPSEFYEIIQRNAKMGTPPTDRPRHYPEDHNQRLADAVMQDINRAIRAGWWKGKKQ